MTDIEKLKSRRKELSMKHRKIVDEFFNEKDELATKRLNLQMSVASKEIDILNLKIELAALSK